MALGADARLFSRAAAPLCAQIRDPFSTKEARRIPLFNHSHSAGAHHADDFPWTIVQERTAARTLALARTREDAFVWPNLHRARSPKRAM